MTIGVVVGPYWLAYQLGRYGFNKLGGCLQGLLVYYSIMVFPPILDAYIKNITSVTLLELVVVVVFFLGFPLAYFYGRSRRVN
jgi:hypothetical protein